MTNALQLDYWDLVGRSVKTAWKHKFLWFFGFFASMGGGGNVGNWQEDASPWLEEFFLRNPYAFVLLIIGVVIIGLALLVMNIICTGGLIRSTSSADRDVPVSFGDTWRAGLSSFWKLLGVSVLAILAFLAVTAVCMVPIVISMLGGAPGIAIALLIGAVLFLPYLAFLFLLAFTVTYAEREVVLRNVDVFGALREGFELTRRHVGKTFMVWLVMFLSGLIFMVGLIVALLILAVPFVLIGIANLFLGLVLGIPVGIIVIVLASGAYGTYSYSVWTLAYERLKGEPSAA